MNVAPPRLLIAVVTKTRSPQTIGLECARPGIGVRHRTFAPVWPEGAVVRASVEGVDEPLLYRIGEESFADPWGHTTTPYDEFMFGTFWTARTIAYPMRCVNETFPPRVRLR